MPNSIPKKTVKSEHTYRFLTTYLGFPARTLWEAINGAHQVINGAHQVITAMYNYFICDFHLCQTNYHILTEAEQSFV